jgi:general L-amino acid transport system permease protein
MATAPPPESQRIPFWRDVRAIAVLLQIAFALAVMFLFWFLYRNMMAGLESANLAPSFRFLSQEAGFPIAEGLPYDPSDSYGYAFLVGIANTIRVAVVGIILATILGITIGMFRLSNNWLLRSIAIVFIETLRNTPLLLQLIFWFFVTRAFPRVQESIAVGNVMYMHNRGVSLAWPAAGAAFAAWMPWLLAALIVAVGVFIGRRVQLKRADRPGLSWPWALLGAFVVALLGWVVVSMTSGQGVPLLIELPELQGFNFVGGVTVSSNFFALLTGLTFYTAAFIAEIVRSGVMSVSKGQREAARALGLNAGQTMRLVIFPQALRVIIPPTTSQYLNLAKNSSLAIAVGYQDIYNISQTIFNQTGQAVPVILMMMASYLAVSLFTSLLMNWYNRRMQLVER